MYLPKFSNVFFFVIIMITTALGLYSYDGYRTSKEQGQDITYPKYVKQQANAIKEGLKQMPGIAQEAQIGSDNIARGGVDKIAEALFIYNLNTNKYPSSIDDLLGGYIPENNKIIQNKSFFYRQKGSGYEMGIALPTSGEMYVVRQK